MEQQHVSSTALPTPEPGVYARSFTRITGDQVDQISLDLEHVKSLVYLLARAFDAVDGPPNADGLSMSQVVDDILDRVKDTLLDAEVRHD